VAREQLGRAAALGAVTIAAIVIVLLLVTGGSNYVLHARFASAGQLVGGDLVTVAGHPVGSVGSLSLTSNGLADVQLNISDSSVTPLRQGTVATIGQLSLTGVSNRFVSLTPGTGAPIANGGTLPTAQTRGIVDLDTLLDSLTPPVRNSFEQLIKTGAYLLSGSTPGKLNQAFHYFNPALSQSAALGSEIVADQFAVDRLVSSTADVATTLANRDADLSGAVTNTAGTLRELASERTALEDLLARAPAVLTQGTGVLADVNYALGVLNPVLTDLRPVAPPLRRLLRAIVPAAANSIPTVKAVAATLPASKQALRALPPVVAQAVPAVNSLAAALPPITPVLAGIRPYAPEVVAGLFGGVGGYGGGYYDANGHYVRISPLFGPGGFSGVLGLLNGVASQLPRFNGTRFGVLAACPGGAVEPSPNGGNPWNNVDALPASGNVCNPADNHP
jgi:phospholipid/cholesterol/gamma-HCH transport system substrate-binding protein